ncbi:MAG: amidohydrolase family protein, partial [Alphaproteobacteria bacterium]|nr:amidohydrolase family protein [Alphaproteobacteria bacterium]
LTLTYKRTVMFGLLSTRQGDDPVSWRTQANAIQDANKAGGRMFGQVGTRSINAIYSLKSYLPFDVLPEWQVVRERPLSEQLQILRDPARRRALIEAEQRMKPKDNVLQGGGAATLDPRKPDYDQLFALKSMDWDDPTVAELSRARGTHPVETMIELSLDNPDQIYVWPVVNEDREDLLGMLKHDFALATFSDAGAHSAQEMGACLQTHFLHYWVNRRGAFTLEQAVRKMTRDIADAFELKDRGLLQPGYKADVVLFEADRVRPCVPKIETDLPGGARRLVQKADGIRATLVNGALTMENGQSTGTFTGEVMKGALG